MADLIGDNYNIHETWDNVCRSFARTTNVDLATSPKFTIDEVLDQIRRKQDDDEQRDAKYKVAKDVIGKTLSCIEVLGGIASQGASMVFGPSALCFNAVSYLIQTGANYKRIFSSIAELFKRISDVLERCKIYLRMPAEAVDISLRRIINEELLCFVDICALSIKVLKGHKVFIALKVFAFNGDEGVGAQLARLAELVERESQMRATLGFESQKASERSIMEARDGARKINAGVDKLLELQQKTEKESTEQKQLQEVDSNLDGPSKRFATMEGRYRELLGRKVDGSGQWLLDGPVYKAWAGCEGGALLDVLCISGGEGYGKSHLLATIIRNLQERYSELTGSLTRTSIAYYFFEQAIPDRAAMNDTPMLVEALKTVAYQLASYDVVYRKELASSSKLMEPSNVISHLWDVLFAKCYRADSTFFILFDSTEQVGRESLKQLLDILVDLQRKISLNTWGKFRLRILFSARDNTVEQITNHLKGEVTSTTIDVASENEADMRMFINYRLNSMEILSSRSTQAVALKAEIRERLMKEARGDFINIGLLLNEIADKERPSEIREVLSQAGEKRSDTIARKIEQLNETLGDDNISDLNELLAWVMNARHSPTLRELEAVLYIKNGEPSLRSLADDIKDRYSALLRIDGDVDPKTRTFPQTATVSMASTSIEQYIQENPASQEGAEDRNTMSGDVTESEVKIVRRFLDLVCDPELFKKFEFDSFFRKKLSRKTARIGVDTNTAHLRILMGCLKASTAGQVDDELAPLVPYGSLFFGDHLRLIDLSLIQPQAKATLGPQLVKMFTDEEVIKRWWTESNVWLRTGWLYSDENADAVLKWLQDSAVTKKLSEKDTEWVRSLSSKSKPDADLFEHVARFIAHRWLQRTTDYYLSEFFCCLYAYSNKIANRKNPSVKRETQDPKAYQTPTSQILEVAEQAQKLLGLQSLGYGETQNVAQTLRQFGLFDDAVKTFQRAMSLQEDNWSARWGLAETYSLQQNFELALETLEAVKASSERGEAKGFSPDDYLDINYILAAWYREVGNVEKAWELYEFNLQEQPDSCWVVSRMVSLLADQKNYKQLLEFLERLKNSKDEKTGLDQRTRAFHENAWNDDYHDSLAAAKGDPNGITMIKDSYRTAVEAAEEKLQLAKDQQDKEEEIVTKNIMVSLMHNYAKFIYDTSTCLEEQQMALSMWEQIIHPGKARVALSLGVSKPYSAGATRLDETEENWGVVRLRRHASQCLASGYFDQAVRAGQGSQLAATYIEELEHLVVANPGEEPARQGRDSIYPVQLLARYYTLCGETEKSKDAIRPFVKINIDLLSDVDPSNDWQGFIGLARAFMIIGQDENSLAAWSLMRGKDNADADHLEPFDSPLYSLCEGRCGFQWISPDNIYVCRQCAAVQFEEDCFKKLKEGTLKRNVCNRSHEMLHIPRPDHDEMERVGKGNVQIGEEIISVEKWIQRIKQDWGLSTE